MNAHLNSEFTKDYSMQDYYLMNTVVVPEDDKDDNVEAPVLTEIEDDDDDEFDEDDLDLEDEDDSDDDDEDDDDED